jgi:hypothetical protein
MCSLSAFRLRATCPQPSVHGQSVRRGVLPSFAREMIRALRGPLSARTLIVAIAALPAQ